MILGVGCNKTGTQSLCAALRILGFRPRHCGGAWLRDCFSHEFNAYADFQFDFRDLRDCRARYILTTRDKEAWMQSRIRHVLQNRITGRSKWVEIDTVAWADEWERHHEQARQLPGVLVYRVADGWGPLCRWLGMPVPDVPYPWENRSPAI